MIKVKRLLNRRRVEDDTYDQSKELCYASESQLYARKGKTEQEDLKVDK